MSPISTAIPLPQIVYAAGSFTGSYTVAGSFTKPVEYLVFISTLNAAIQVSFDGVNDHIAIPAGNSSPVYFPISFKSNSMNMGPCIISVKEIGTPSTGSLYVSAFSAVIP